MISGICLLCRVSLESISRDRARTSVLVLTARIAGLVIRILLCCFATNVLGYYFAELVSFADRFSIDMVVMVLFMSRYKLDRRTAVGG